MPCPSCLTRTKNSAEQIKAPVGYFSEKGVISCDWYKKLAAINTVIAYQQVLICSSKPFIQVGLLKIFALKSLETTELPINTVALLFNQVLLKLK